MLKIQTPRLQLRALMKSDAKELYDAVIETMDQLTPWVSWAQSYKLGDLTVAEKFISNTLAEIENQESWQFGVWYEEHFVGIIGLIGLEKTTQSIEVGYWCRKSAQGKGFVTEGANALVRFAFEELHIKCVLLICQNENFKSASVAERLHFTLGRIGTYDGDVDSKPIYRFYTLDQIGVLPELKVTWER